MRFFELPIWQKFNKFDINNPLDRWMHFFTNTNFYTMISLEEQQMLDKIFSTVDLLDTTKHTIEQLRGYDQFIDNIMIRETDLDEAYKRGFAEGYAEGFAEGLEEGTNKRRELLIDEMKLEKKPPRPRVEGEGYSVYFYDFDSHLFELHSGTLAMRLKRYARGK